VPFVDTPRGPIEVLATGRGAPVTVFAHGLASSISETRPFGSGVGGTRVFLHFPGHEATPARPSSWTYPALAAELRAVVDAYGASRGLGVSLGAGALLLDAWSRPASYERLVLVLPSAIDRPRHDGAVRRLQRMAALVDGGDVEGLAADLVAQQPSAARDRPDVAVWAHRQATRLVHTAVGRALHDLPAAHPLESGADLAAIRCRVLVLGQEGDEAHPAAIARELAQRLPDVSLHVFDAGGLVWTHRAEVRGLVSSFLNA
jgi:pimeloyl-ACP methyl ester carboxylesterase